MRGDVTTILEMKEFIERLLAGEFGPLTDEMRLAALKALDR